MVKIGICRGIVIDKKSTLSSILRFTTVFRSYLFLSLVQLKITAMKLSFRKRNNF
jgi:hypothetical protein